MDNNKQTTRKTKRGVIAASIALLITLLTIGAGIAMGAENGISVICLAQRLRMSNCDYIPE